MRPDGVYSLDDLSLCRRDRIWHAFSVWILAVDWLEAREMGRLDKVIFLCPHLKLEALKNKLLYESLDLMGIVASERLV